MAGHAIVLAILAVTALLSWTAPASAQRDWNRVDDPLREAVGLHIGKIGGVGLAYKYPVQWWLYLQVAGGIWHTDDHKRHNVGFELQYILRQDDRLRLYAAAGAGYFYHKKSVQPVGGPEYHEVDDTWNTGFGLGIELLRSDRIAFQIEGDFTHEGDDDDIIFLPQAAVYLYF